LGVSTNLNRIVNLDGKYLIAAVEDQSQNKDNFIQIDLSDYSKTTYFQPSQNIRASQLFGAGGFVHFVEASSGLIYSLR
jgi:hypothetical protein